MALRFRWKWMLPVASLFFFSPALADEEDDAREPGTKRTAVAEKLPWHNSLSTGIEEARRRKTQILVRVGADWCGWCRRLDKEIVLPEVQKELSKWTLVELDADDDVADVRRLGVGPIPALRVLNVNGRAVRSHDGYLPGEELILWLRGEDASSADELLQDLSRLPQLDDGNIEELVKLLAHRDASIREVAVRRLKPGRNQAAADVVKLFAKGKLGARLAAIDLLTDWKAPVKDLDPWQPQTITAESLSDLEEWAEKIVAEGQPAEQPPEPLTPEQQTEIQSEIQRILMADSTEAEAIGARLAHFGDRLLPLIQDAKQRAETDQSRERLDWLSYRVVASDSLMLKWPNGLTRLASMDGKQRHAAIVELHEFVTQADVSLLIALFGHPDPLVRELSLKALHEIGGQRSSNELIRLLADPEPNVRAAVLKQLAEKPSPKLVSQIASYISKETDPDLIVHAIRLLREIKNEESVKCLLSLFSHSSWQVRSEAAEAVGKIVGEGARYGQQKIEASVVADAWTAVIELLNDPDGFVVGQAVNALSYSDLPIAVAPLAKVADRQPELAENVAVALTHGSKIQEKGIKQLQGWLSHSHEKLRTAAVRHIHPLHGPTELIPALSDKSETVRVAAAQRLLGMCEERRSKSTPVSKTRTVADEEPDGEAAPAPPSLVARAAEALGLGSASKPEPKKKKKASKVDSEKVGEKPIPDELAQPYEEWLIRFRSGKGQWQWMSDCIPPLQVMFQSESLDERITSGVVLIALGQDQALEPLIKLATDAHDQQVKVALALPWLPWQSRIDTFRKLWKLADSTDQQIELFEQLVALEDLRAGDALWDLLTDPKINATLANSIYDNWLKVHGVQMYHRQVSQGDKPIGFRPKTLKAIAETSMHEWQRRFALALLLQYDPETAIEAAKTVMNDESLPNTLRADGFITLLKCESDEGARDAALSAIRNNQSQFIRPAFIVLNLDPGQLRSFAGGQFELPHLSGSVMVHGQLEKKKKLPNDLNASEIAKYITGTDEELGAHAAYLSTMLGQPQGIDLLIAQWKRVGEKDEESASWRKMVYEAIAAADDAKYVPILDEVYQALQNEGQYYVRDFYWTIRSMHGPEILKLRKRIRDEVGMDQLR